MEAYIRQIRKEGDTVGGIITCVIQNVPVGLGEPPINFPAELGKAMLSINAVKGFEYGSGFAGTMKVRGRLTDGVHNRTVLGVNWYFNGMDIYFNVAFNDCNGMQEQETINNKGEGDHARKRSYPCRSPRGTHSRSHGGFGHCRL